MTTDIYDFIENQSDDWREDDKEHDRINELTAALAHAGVHGREWLEEQSTTDLVRMYQLLESIYQAEEEDTELDRDSDEFFTQQDGLRFDMRQVRVTLVIRRSGE